MRKASQMLKERYPEDHPLVRGGTGGETIRVIWVDPEAGRQLVVGMISAPALPLFPSPQVVMCAPPPPR